MAGDLAEGFKSLSPKQWVMIAGGGLGLGLYLRHRKKSAAVSTGGVTDTPFTTASTQQYGNYSGSGQTGWFAGGASTVDPNASSAGPASPVSTGPAPGDIKTVNNPDGTFTTFYWNGFEWVIAQASTPPAPPTPVAAPTPPPQPAPNPPPPYVPPAPAPAPSPGPTNVMDQGTYLGAVGPAWDQFSQPGGYLDKFFANPNVVQILGPNGQPATTSQVLADLQARGLPISPSWRAIN